MSKQEKFWFVWNPLRKPPQHKHESFVTAKTEAERLARSWVNEEFVILESIGHVKKKDTEFVQHGEQIISNEGVPF